MMCNVNKEIKKVKLHLVGLIQIKTLLSKIISNMDIGHGAKVGHSTTKIERLFVERK